MNLLRKSSMILLGAATAGLLAFACADNSDGSASGDIANLTAKADHLLISQVYGGAPSTAAEAKGADYVELFNPTATAISLKGLALQVTTADHAFDPAAKLALDTGAVTSVASGHYFLVSFGKGVDLGAPADLEFPTDKGNAIDMKAASVMLVTADKVSDCETSEACGAIAMSLVGYGKSDTHEAAAATTGATAPTNGARAVTRLLNGCQETGSNATDFGLAAPAPHSNASNGFDCSSLAANNEADAGDAGDAAAATGDAGDGGDAGTSKPPTPRKDAGTKTDSGTSTDDGSNPEQDVPPPTTGKKKTTSANTPPQPIAASSPSCSTSSGPASAGGFAGLAGIGLALASLGRRRNRNK